MSTLFVGNIAYTTSEGEIVDLFRTAGNVVRCKLIMDRVTNRSKGFAFVDMATAADAQQAIEALNGREVDGRALRVNEARPREERPRLEMAPPVEDRWAGRRENRRFSQERDVRNKSNPIF